MMRVVWTQYRCLLCQWTPNSATDIEAEVEVLHHMRDHHPAARYGEPNGDYAKAAQGVSMNPDPRPSSPSQVHQLIEKWKLFAAGKPTSGDDYYDGQRCQAWKCARELEAALTADAASLPPKGWQPIAEASKDEAILAGAYHRSGRWLWDHARYYRFPRLNKEEWIMSNGMTPTHFMPLPDPPVDQGTPEPKRG